MNIETLNQNQLLAAIADPQVAELLFDQLPDIVFFVKDVQGHYQLVNQSLVERCGLSHKNELCLLYTSPSPRDA